MAVTYNFRWRKRLHEAIGDTGDGMPFDKLVLTADALGRPKLTFYQNGTEMVSVFAKRNGERVEIAAEGYLRVCLG